MSVGLISLFTPVSRDGGSQAHCSKCLTIGPGQVDKSVSSDISDCVAGRLELSDAHPEQKFTEDVHSAPWGKNSDPPTYYGS
jgi:hypothetical protein